MLTYRPSDVFVNIVPNTRIINLASDARIPAIVGMGTSTLQITDESVVRGAVGTYDSLSVLAKNVSGVVATQFASRAGVTGGQFASLISTGGALYASGSATVTTSGSVLWGSGSVDIPAAGTTYYVNYSCTKPASYYEPIMLSDKGDVEFIYGTESTNNNITIAANLAIENGAPAVMTVQATGSVFNVTAYKNAIDKLQKKTNIEDIIVVFPSGTARASQEEVISYAYGHISLMNSQNRERGLFFGSPTTYYSSTGTDAIGDASTSGTYAYIANAYKNKNISYVVSSRTQRRLSDSTLVDIDANFAAAAVAGVRAAQPKKSTPIHGFSVVGLVLEEDRWTPTELTQLGAANCMVLLNQGGNVTIVDALTTDPTSADTQEISVVAQERLVKRSIRNGLKNTYLNKGYVIGDQTSTDLTSTTRSILSTLVSNNEIYGFGEAINPATGEVNITAKQNPSEPRQFDIACAVKYLYPLKWVVVSVNIYI